MNNVDKTLGSELLVGVASVMSIARSIKSCLTPGQIISSANWLEQVRGKTNLRPEEYCYLRGLIFEKCAALSKEDFAQLISEIGQES